jgi:hypothetical protein
MLDPARAKNRSILLLKQEYSPCLPLLGSNSILFSLHPLGLLLRNILILIRSVLLLLVPLALHSHLASASLFFFSPGGSDNSLRSNI